MQELLRAKAFYVGDEVNSNTRVATRMSAGTGAAPGQAPPDLPSLLLDGRICYIGMPVSGAVSMCVLTSDAAGTRHRQLHCVHADRMLTFLSLGLLPKSQLSSHACSHRPGCSKIAFQDSWILSSYASPHITVLSVLRHTERLHSFSSCCHISHCMSKGR